MFILTMFVSIHCRAYQVSTSAHMTDAKVTKPFKKTAAITCKHLRPGEFTKRRYPVNQST